MSQTLPDKVIVNIKNAFDDFLRDAGEGHDEYNFLTKEIIHSLVNCLHTKSLAEWQLREFVAEVEFGETLRVNLTRVNPHGDAVLALGLAILHEIDQLNLYDDEGRLPYEYDDPDLRGFRDLLLTRIND